MLADDYSVSLLCDLLGCTRSSYYYQAKQQDENEVKSAIQDVVAEWPTYGYRRVTKQLQRQGWDVNKKRVHRLMRGMGLLVKTKRKARKTTNSEHDFPRYPNLVQDLEIVRPDQVWVSDVTYIRLRDEFVYLAVIMDVFTRSIRGWHLGRSLDQSLTLIALDRALASHRPEIHHSDRAPVRAFVFSGVDTPFPAEKGTAQRLTLKSKDQWEQSVTQEKGKRESHQTNGFLRAKLDMAKARLPEPQDRAGFVVSGGKDGDTHSLLDKETVGPRPLFPPKRRIPIYRG
jgi:hypothetical protein